jgi:glyoxylase-like metal-dependent hydrolase (beta-lactamase superfamily II)
VCFLIGKHLVSGDTIFPGGPGKTESPGDLRQIIESITSKVFVLPDDTEIYPGHGDPTLVRKEKTELAIFSSRSHDPNLFGEVLWLSS